MAVHFFWMIGLIQLLYVISLIIWLIFRIQMEVMKGVLIGAILTGILNGSGCYLLMVVGSLLSPNLDLAPSRSNRLKIGKVLPAPVEQVFLRLQIDPERYEGAIASLLISPDDLSSREPVVPPPAAEVCQTIPVLSLP